MGVGELERVEDVVFKCKRSVKKKKVFKQKP